MTTAELSRDGRGPALARPMQTTATVEAAMKNNRIAGKIVRFSFDDGPMAGKTFEHSFDVDGTVKFRQMGGEAKPGAERSDAKDASGSPGTKYEVGSIRDDVFAVSYLSPTGYTLTAILDFKTNGLVAFSSNEKMHLMQHGTFEVASSEAPAEPAKRDGRRAPAPHRGDVATSKNGEPISREAKP